MKTCRHCQQNKVNRPRGLCWTCYYTSGVRDLYPSTVASGAGHGCGGYALAPEPTPAPPGSAGKVAVLEERAQLGVALWHPLDAVAS